MEKGSMVAGGILCWPDNNHYFRLGVDALLEQALAKYFAAGDDRVLAVFPSDLPVRRLVTALTHPVSHGGFRATRSAISSRDIYILRHHLGASTTGDLAEKYALSTKTVYGRKAAMAALFGVRRLEHLFLVE